MSPYSQSQISPYSQQPSPQMSPYSHQSPKMSPYSQPSPKMSPYDQPSPKMSPYSQPSPKMSPYSQPSPKMSPYSQQSPKMSPYSQVSPAYHQTGGALQASPSYLAETISPSCSLQQKQESVFPVPSFSQNPEQIQEPINEPPKAKTLDQLSNKETTLRSTTDSPRLETPPGLNIPANTESFSKKNSPPATTASKVDAHLQSNNVPSTKVTTVTTTSVASSSLFSNPISGMASMTNKIKLLESKMQTSKSKSSIEKNLEDNSLKNWWKPQTDLLKKNKPPVLSKPVQEEDKTTGDMKTKDCNLETSTLFSKPGVDFNNENLSSLSGFDHRKHKISAKERHITESENYSAPALPKETERKNESLNYSFTSFSDPVSSFQKNKCEARDPPHEAKGYESKERKYFDNDQFFIPKSYNEQSSKSIKQLPSRNSDEALYSSKPSLKEHTAAPVAGSSSTFPPSSKKQIPPYASKFTRDSSPVPYDPQSQRSLDSYATPNLERMEVKNSGIPGPSAVTWKRKSTEDSPNNFNKSKKRKINKSSSDSNDVYQFEEEKDPGVDAASKDEKITKGPVYKYKSALISRDYDSDSSHSRNEETCEKVVKDDEVKVADTSIEPQPVAKKKNKRPKHEEWSVLKTKSAKSSRIETADTAAGSKPKGTPWNSKADNKLPSPQPLEILETVKSPEPSEPTEPVKKEVSVEKWYQAFGASDTRNKKKPDKNIQKIQVKEEVEEKTAISILDIPPEIRRKSRPNFGGIVHFSPDWNRLVKRHHDRCRLPDLLDTSATLSPKILVGQTTPKKNYEDFARKDMVSPPDMLTLERERMEANALTDVFTPKSPTRDLGGELPSILENILENRKKLRQATKMGLLYQIPFKKEKKRMMRMRMTKAVMESSSNEDNLGLIPTPGLPLLDLGSKEVPLVTQSNSTYGNFRLYTLNNYLDFGEQGKPSTWTPEVLDSKTRSKASSAIIGPAFREIFGTDTPLAKIKGKKDKREVDHSKEEPIKKAKTKKEIEIETPVQPIFKEKIVQKEKELDDTFAFSQEVGEPTEEENILQTELGGFALDLLDDNPSWIKEVTIQNLVVWEPIQPISIKKKKPKKKKGKRCGWDFPVGKRKSKTSREPSRASSPVYEEIHDIEYTLENVVQESNRWVVDKNAGETILQRACKMGYPDVVAYAVGMQEMSVKEKDYAGFTPMDKAAFRGNHEVVRILLKYGADPSSGVKGTRALHDGNTFFLFCHK